MESQTPLTRDLWSTTESTAMLQCAVQPAVSPDGRAASPPHVHEFAYAMTHPLWKDNILSSGTQGAGDYSLCDSISFERKV